MGAHRADRVGIVLSPDMIVALSILSEKSGLPFATQAMVSLRQALARTIDSEECRERLRVAGAFQTRAEWLTGRENQAYVENAVARATKRAQDDEKAAQAT